MCTPSSCFNVRLSSHHQPCCASSTVTIKPGPNDMLGNSRACCTLKHTHVQAGRSLQSCQIPHKHPSFTQDLTTSSSRARVSGKALLAHRRGGGVVRHSSSRVPPASCAPQFPANAMASRGRIAQHRLTLCVAANPGHREGERDRASA